MYYRLFEKTLNLFHLTPSVNRSTRPPLPLPPHQGLLTRYINNDNSTHNDTITDERSSAQAAETREGGRTQNKSPSCQEDFCVSSLALFCSRECCSSVWRLRCEYSQTRPPSVLDWAPPTGSSVRLKGTQVSSIFCPNNALIN